MNYNLWVDYPFRMVENINSQIQLLSKLNNKIMKTLYYILNALLSILILIFVEGMATLGSAFNFESYNWFGCFIQVILISVAIIISILFTHEQIKQGEI